MNAIDLLDTVLVDPELFKVNALVNAAYTSNFVGAKKELLEHRQSIKLSYRINLVAGEPHFLQEATLFESFYLRHSLIDNVELRKVRKVYQPVHPVDVIEAEVYSLYASHILLVDA